MYATCRCIAWITKKGSLAVTWLDATMKNPFLGTFSLPSTFKLNATLK